LLIKQQKHTQTVGITREVSMTTSTFDSHTEQMLHFLCAYTTVISFSFLQVLNVDIYFSANL